MYSQTFCPFYCQWYYTCFIYQNPLHFYLGLEGKPNAILPEPATAAEISGGSTDDINSQIVHQRNLLKQVKEEKAEKVK